MLLLRNIFFFFHMIGLVMLAGALVGGMVLERAVRAQLRASPPELERATPLLRSSGQLGQFAKYGGILMLITGIGILWTTHWMYWGQRWLDIKLVLYVLIVLVGAVGIGSTSRKLRQALVPVPASSAAEGGAVLALSPEIPVLLDRLKMFEIADWALFLAIILLAVFKP